MSDDKPGVDSTPKPEAMGNSSAEGSQDAPASQNLMETLSDDQKAYLKGIGVNDISGETVAKIIDTAIKQKASVSKSSREIAELKAMLSSRGQESVEDTDDYEEQTQPENETSNYSSETPERKYPTSGQNSGVTQNDLFDLSLMIQNNFPELVAQATDGSLFDDLRIHGYFGVTGIDKKATYEYLSKKNAEAKELRELREFKKSHSRGAAGTDAQYRPQVDLAQGTSVSNVEEAKRIVMSNISGQKVNPELLRNARALLQQDAYNRKAF